MWQTKHNLGQIPHWSLLNYFDSECRSQTQQQLQQQTIKQKEFYRRMRLQYMQ